jgi:hypothetical protein
LEVPLNDKVAELRRDFGMQGLPGHFSRNGCNDSHAIAQACGSTAISVGPNRRFTKCMHYSLYRIKGMA